MTAVTVSNNPAQHRFEAHLDGVLAGFADYQLTDELVVFTHTEVDRAHEGKGVGSALARHALEETAAGTRKVLAVCPFILAYIQRHPEYAPLLFNSRTSATVD